MNRVVYLTILATLWLNCWNVVPFGYISGNIYYFVTMAYMVFGLFHFNYETELPFWTEKMKPFYFIFGGILLSMIPAYMFYGQSFIQSLLTYRVQYLWIFVPLLYRMAPSEEEIVKAMFNTTLLMWGVFLLRLYDPQLIVMDEETLERMQESERTLYITGFTLPAIPLYYYLGRIKDDFNYRHLIPIVVCYAYLFTMQNRSLLFPVSLFIGFTFLKIRSKYRFELAILLALVAAFFVKETYDTWFTLLDASGDNISDKDYNRNIAIAYFLTSNTHPANYILGNGFISNNVSDIMSKLMKMGIYNSDVGFVGYWHQFGLIPIGTFIWLTGYALFKKCIPYNLKLWGAQILICALTISYFGASQEILFFSLFIYLIFYYKEIGQYYDGEEEEDSKDEYGFIEEDAANELY